jgi:small neutral amino acid transporter SnatA (MarC family)
MKPDDNTPTKRVLSGKIAGLLLTALAVQLMILGFTDLGLIEARVAH